MAKDVKVDSGKLSKVTTNVVELLNPFASEERQKIINAAMMLLGENDANLPRSGAPKEAQSGAKDGVVGLAAKATAWVRQNGLTKDQLDHVFDIDGGTVTLIADNIPGKTSKD